MFIYIVFYLSYGIPNDHLGWVCGSSWGFHVFIFIVFYLSHGMPNNHWCWVCSGSWAFHICILLFNHLRWYFNFAIWYAQ